MKLESNRFYIHFPEQAPREISLIAEGLRKVVMWKPVWFAIASKIQCHTASAWKPTK